MGIWPGSVSYAVGSVRASAGIWAGLAVSPNSLAVEGNHARQARLFWRVTGDDNAHAIQAHHCNRASPKWRHLAANSAGLKRGKASL
jgi:hypothetical protein